MLTCSRILEALPLLLLPLVLRHVHVDDDFNLLHLLYINLTIRFADRPRFHRLTQGPAASVNAFLSATPSLFSVAAAATAAGCVIRPRLRPRAIALVMTRRQKPKQSVRNRQGSQVDQCLL
jgi:hypothetical protein